jgi:hypothetical protein
MKADKHLQELLAISPLNFSRMVLWEQSKFLDSTMDKWIALRRISPYQSHKWQAKFWQLAGFFTVSLSSSLDIISAKTFSTKESRQPPNCARLLNRLHALDEAQTHKLMLKTPKAFTIVKEDWANWVQIVV